MSEYQLRAVNVEDEPVGSWFDIAYKERFWTDGRFVLIRKKPEPRGAGWYQSVSTLSRVDLNNVLYFSADPGDGYRKMNVEPQEDAA